MSDPSGNGANVTATATLLADGSFEAPAAPALAIGIVIALAAAFFGGNHDNPGNMPDKYDTQNYGQGVANLQGYAGASGQNFTEDAHLTNLLGGRTGIQAIEETLAYYGDAASAPTWLKPMFDKLEGMFGESASGSGKLSIGIDGGKDVNNQRITFAPGTDGSGIDGKEYQYTQLDAAMASFQAAYAKALAAGQAVAMSWDSNAAPGSLPPADAYGTTSYQATEYYA